MTDEQTEKQTVPEAIAPVIAVGEPNDAVRLYAGPMRLLLDGTLHSVDGAVDFVWLPDPRIQFDCHVDIPWIDLPETSELEVPGVLSRARCLVVETNPGGPAGTRLRGILVQPAEQGDADRAVESIDFLVTNYHHCRGQSIQDSRQEGHLWSGRQTFQFGQWLVALDGLESRSMQGDHFLAKGGYVVTHTGRLVREGGSAFAPEDARAALKALHFWLAFLRGFWVGPILPSGISEGRTAWRQVIAPVLSPWRSVRSWYPRQSIPTLDAPASRFLELWETEEWRTPLKHTIWWYVEANTAATSDSALVMAHTALELLGWTILVETGGVISADGFERLPASDKLRVLLGTMQIPLAIPDSFSDLHAYAKAVTELDGPGVVARMRNAIVHPTLKKRQLLSQASGTTKHQARELTLGYLELVLLAFLGFDDVYLDRAATGYVSEAQRPVPWAG